MVTGSGAQQRRRFIQVHLSRTVAVYQKLQRDDEVQGERAQAADEPGQVMDHVAGLALTLIRVLQQDAQAICSVPQDD